MNDLTIKRLNAINRQFYQITATSFDESRDHPWPGWEKLLSYLAPPLSVLDVGCGNGRFGVFLAERLSNQIRYHGLDNNMALLDRARAALQTVDARLDQQDVVEHQPDSGEYDLVALFGVLHHIPGAQNRQRFIQRLAERVAPGGLFVFASWRFYEYERFRARIVPWPADLQVEPHDYLLDWRRGDHALRYCHYVDDTEQRRLIAATELTELATFRADGRTNNINCYSVLKRDIS